MACLTETSLWVEPTLTIQDQGEVLTFHIQDALNYHGYDAVGGVVLGFRLLQKALSVFQANAQTVIERRHISLLTAFPGLGARDCFELITRMVTDGRYVVQPDMVYPNVVQGVKGCFYFEFKYHNQTLKLSTMPGSPDETFIALGKKSKEHHVSSENQLAWREAKFNLANALLTSHCHDVVRVLA